MAGDADGLDPLGYEPVDNLVDVLLVAARDYHPAPFLAEPLDDGLADARGGGGDDGHFTLE